MTRGSKPWYLAGSKIAAVDGISQERSHGPNPISCHNHIFWDVPPCIIGYEQYYNYVPSL
jgi:hypothetical protein